jgi:peptidoglycan/LPS O-acetylase OafA/YrhL
VYHVWLYSAHGNVDLDRLGVVVPDLAYGVTLFFTLSGFLLYWPFAAAILRRTDGPQTRRYLRNRALRIVPAYWVILLACSFLFQSTLEPDGTKGALSPFVLVQSMFFVQNYVPDQIVTGIGPAWSLNVEVVFYLLLPLLGLLGIALRVRLGPLAAALTPAAFLLLLGLGGKALAAWAVPPRYAFGGWESDWHSVLERSFICQADLFAFGMVLAVVRVLWEDGAVRLPAWWRLPVLFGAGAALVVIAVKMTNHGEQLSYSPWNSAVALCFAVLLSVVVLGERSERKPPALVRALEWRPLVALGVVSYSVFLWHEPLIYALQEHGLTFPGRAGLLANLVLVASVTLVLSYATYRFVEAPSLRRRTPRRATPELQPMTAATERAAP